MSPDEPRAAQLEELSRAFEDHRPRLLRLAYSTLGSLAEAEDCVQEAWLRLSRLADPSAVRDLRAWLTTTVGRLALDALGSARVRRERQVGTWLPEPLVREGGEPDPADRITLDESVSMALLVVLERLSPEQRTAFLLHDVFGMPFSEVASIVGRTPAAARQLATRARAQVEQGGPRFPPTRAEQQELVSAFQAACERGDLDGLIALLAPDVVCRGDGGGKLPAFRHPLRGAETVAKVLIGLTRRTPRAVLTADVNGAPGLVMWDHHGLPSVTTFTMDAGRITRIDIMRDPAKLTTAPDAAKATDTRSD